MLPSRPCLTSACLALALLLGAPALAQTARPAAEPASPHTNIRRAILAESGARTPEVSTEELQQILAQGSALILDTRPHLEWALGHIPGALNVAPKPGVSMSLYTSDVAEVERLTRGEKSRPIILYCNGAFCGKSKRVAEDLLGAGFTQVRRYQLGAPVWRALGGVMEIEPDGIRHVRAGDRTAVFVDARAPAQFRAGSIPGARNIPLAEVATAKDDGRLPMEDHNTRIIVFGGSPEEARAVAQEIARNAFHNVSYFPGTFAQLTLLLPLLAALAFVGPPPTDTVFVLGSVERDLTGDGRAEVLRLVAAGKSVDSLDVTFSIMSDRAILYTESMVPLTRRAGFDGPRRMLSRARHRANVAEFAGWFFEDAKFMSPSGFIEHLRETGGMHIPLIPHVIDGDRAEGTPSDMARAASIWEEIQRSNVTIFTYSPGGDGVRAIAWSRRDQRFYQLWECC